MNYFMNTPWIFGLVIVSGLIGIVGSFMLFLILLRATGAKEEKIQSREFFYTGFLTGVVERSFFTCIIGLLGSNGIAQAVVTWIAIKGQVHYKMFSDASSVDIPRAYLGLLGSMSSLIFAVFGGYLWEHGWTLNRILEWLNS